MPKVFSNPLRQGTNKGSEVYPYYAGFSEAFVVDAVNWLGLDRGTVLDPWVGAGTTTRAAKGLRVNSIGFDLNPVMVFVAKSEQLDRADANVLYPLAKKIVAYADTVLLSEEGSALEIFFERKTAKWISATALAVWLHLVDSEPPAKKDIRLQAVSPLPALYFVGLFNVVRALLAPLRTSNPTWLKTPIHSDQRVSASKSELKKAYLEEVQRLSTVILKRLMVAKEDTVTSISVADSRALPLQDRSVQGIITSPPYCTRLDYGRATMPELLILESIGLTKYEESRLKLMGAAITRHDAIQPVSSNWGETCQELLEKIYHHPSKASQSYYYRLHYSYFSDLYKSISEISRVMTGGGRACVVVQDSFYKEIHNDLPKIFTEMAAKGGIVKIGEHSYQKRRSMCQLNSASSAYRAKRVPMETALLFEKRY